MQLNEIQDAVDLAFKYNLPAIVVHPGLSSDAIIAKSRAGGKFKIISPIDWPKGETFGTVKLRGLSIDTLETDGFEFLLTPNKLELETRNEAMALTDFVRRHISPITEVRFVLGTSTRLEENINTMCRGLLTVRTPSMIRTDTQLKLQVSKANTEEHNRQIDNIRNIIKTPIKVSGNITNLKAITSINADRYGVNLLQAKTIIKEFNSQPSELRELLNSDKTPPTLP